MTILASSFQFTVADALRKNAVIRAADIAVEDAERRFTYAELNRRVNRLAHALAARGIGRGGRVAILSENSIAYLELELAAAKLGAIVPCLNWRLSDAELQHCIRLTTPALIFVSARFAAQLGRIDHGVRRSSRSKPNTKYCSPAPLTPSLTQRPKRRQSPKTAS